MAVCPHCGIRWPDSGRLTGERGWRLTTQGWAPVILNIMRQLEYNTDLYLNYYREYLHGTEQGTAEQLYKARASLKETILYPLENIIKDMGDLGVMEKKIRLFMEA